MTAFHVTTAELLLAATVATVGALVGAPNVTAIAAATEIEMVAVVVDVPLVAVTVKVVAVKVEVGIPDRTPVPELKIKPVGKATEPAIV